MGGVGVRGDAAVSLLPLPFHLNCLIVAEAFLKGLVSFYPGQ